MDKNANSKFNVILLDVLWSLIIQQQLNQKQLAKKLGVSQSYVSKIKSQTKARLDLGELWQICKKLDIPFNYVIERTVERCVKEISFNNDL